MKKIILLIAGFTFFSSNTQSQNVIDIDSNVYNTVTIGTQTWMRENLRVTHFRTGDSIQDGSNYPGWEDIYTGVYSISDYDSVSQLFGALYNWFAVDDNRSLCPSGWHIPDTSEWSALFSYLGGDSIAGGKMKEADTVHWKSPNSGATNSSGFTALPAGFRLLYGQQTYTSIGTAGCFWSADEVDVNRSYGLFIAYNRTNVFMGIPVKQTGYSIRCICDSMANTINEKKNHFGIKIYPNPATNKIIIDCPDYKNLSLFIYSIVGKIILQRKLINGTNEVDISFLSKGLYIIKVSGAEWAVQQKLVKE
jgi:uncharacterized protein (TIGR02145 family)